MVFGMVNECMWFYGRWMKFGLCGVLRFVRMGNGSV